LKNQTKHIQTLFEGTNMYCKPNFYFYFQKFNLAKGPTKNIKDFFYGVNKILDKELLKTSKTIFFLKMSFKKLENARK
jgi:hypothetical protein